MSRKIISDVMRDAALYPVGCRISGGGLEPALTAKENGGFVPEKIKYAYRSECADRFFAATDAALYISVKGTAFTELTALSGDGVIFADSVYKGKNACVVFSGNKAVAVTDTSYTEFKQGIKLYKGVMHLGRLWAIDYSDRYKLRWSGPDGALDWKEGIFGSGYFSPDPAAGEIVDVAVHCGRVVLLRKYGLTVMDGYGTPENFGASQNVGLSFEIKGGTAQSVSGGLYFFTADGLYVFDGGSVKKVFLRAERDISEPTFSSSAGGLYFLGCYSSHLKRKAVMCYDTADGESYLIDTPSEGICFKDKPYSYGAGKGCNLVSGGEFTFTAENLNLGSIGKKTMTALYIDGKRSPFDVTVNDGKNIREFKAARDIIRPNLRGANFTVKVKGYKRLYSLKAEAEIMNGI